MRSILNNDEVMVGKPVDEKIIKSLNERKENNGVSRMLSYPSYERHASSSSLGSPQHQCMTKKLRARSNRSLTTDERDRTYRLLVLGATSVGKTAIISQLLYDQIPQDHTHTVQQMYLGKFGLCGPNICIEIEDTSGAYNTEFPAMFDMSLKAADGILLVFDASNLESFEEVRTLWDEITKKKCKIPTVVVCNKMDLRESRATEDIVRTITKDWSCGFIHCNAKESASVSDVFKQLLGQIKLMRGEGVLVLGSGARHCFVRTQSSPAIPVFQKKATTIKDTPQHQRQTLCKIS